MNVPKRRKVVVSMARRLEALKRLDRGETARQIAKEYGVGAVTVGDWRRKREDIEKWCRNTVSWTSLGTRKTMKRGEHENVDNALFCWFSLQRAKGVQVSGPKLQEMALCFNKELNDSPSDFTASDGWLDRWKKRFGARNLSCVPSQQEDNEFTLGLKVEDSSNGLNSEEVFHSQSRIEQEHMEQPSRSTFADVEIALLHLHQEKLLLELEKISEERERIATEKKNIILHSEILKLRLQLAGCFRLAQMGINSVNTNAGTEDFLQNVNVSVSSHSVQQIQDSSTVKTKSSASALGTESKLPQLLPSKTRVSVCPEKPLIKIPPNMNSQPIHKQCSSTSNYPASFLPNKRPFLSDTVENLCLFPVTIPSSASHFLAPLLNIEGLSPPMTHLNIVQTDINNDKTSGISGSSQIGLVLQDCNSQQERLLFAKPSSQSMPATNSKDVHAISPTSIAGLDPPPIAFSKTILNQMVNSSLLNSSSRLERSRKAQESTDDFLSPYSKDSSVERNKCIFVTSSDSKAGSVPKVKEKVDIAGPSKKLRLSTEDSR
ncbi:uncharacterized protein [Anabrus simplex]|uniref:uncharacterized protein isoform X1 n=1 Tax=Anabrus simplex TaxID=316456 RepID=UPI0035A2DC65